MSPAASATSTGTAHAPAAAASEPAAKASKPGRERRPSGPAATEQPPRPLPRDAAPPVTTRLGRRVRAAASSHGPTGPSRPRSAPAARRSYTPHGTPCERRIASPRPRNSPTIPGGPTDADHPSCRPTTPRQTPTPGPAQTRPPAWPPAPAPAACRSALDVVLPCSPSRTRDFLGARVPAVGRTVFQDGGLARTPLFGLAGKPTPHAARCSRINGGHPPRRRKGFDSGASSDLGSTRHHRPDTARPSTRAAPAWSAAPGQPSKHRLPGAGIIPPGNMPPLRPPSCVLLLLQSHDEPARNAIRHSAAGHRSQSLGSWPLLSHGQRTAASHDLRPSAGRRARPPCRSGSNTLGRQGDRPPVPAVGSGHQTRGAERAEPVTPSRPARFTMGHARPVGDPWIPASVQRRL